MRGLSILSLAALSVPLASAAFDGNLNYESPSRRHVNLGIDVAHVTRRSMKRGNVAFKPSQLNFTHGIASGDPYADSVILWTRIAPSADHDWSNKTVEGVVDLYNHETEAYIKADPNPVCVEWKVWEPESSQPRTYGKGKGKGKGPGNGNGHGNDRIAAKGTAYTTSDIDYTVKVGKMYCSCTSGN